MAMTKKEVVSFSRFQSTKRHHLDTPPLAMFTLLKVVLVGCDKCVTVITSTFVDHSIELLDKNGKGNVHYSPTYISIFVNAS